LQHERVHPAMRRDYRSFLYRYFHNNDRYLQLDLQLRYKMLKEQSGGAIKHIYKGHKFKVDETKIDDTTYSVRINGYDDENINCVGIEITEGIAQIENIGYFPNCAKDGLPAGGGKILMDWALTYLMTNKERFHIKRIILQDNSRLISKCKHDVWLAITSTLTSGETWYGKYGFLPYAPVAQTPDKIGLKNYNMNIKIMKVTKLKDVDLAILVKPLDKELADELKNTDKNTLLKKVLKRISSKDPCALSYNYDYLMKKLGLTDFSHKSFFLDI
jgi:hypothetical protein